VDLVADHRHPVPGSTFDDRGQLLVRVYPADRVVRVAQHVGGRLGGERPVQGRQVELPVAQRHRLQFGAGFLQPVEER
jgi:hypothetical protein